jgi:hypothetical protein
MEVNGSRLYAQDKLFTQEEYRNKILILLTLGSTPETGFIFECGFRFNSSKDVLTNVQVEFGF